MKIDLCIDPLLKEILAERGVRARVFDSILEVSERQEMLENLDRFASNWFLKKGEDITTYRQVSIGAAIHDDILTFFHLLYHFSLIVEKLEFENAKITFYQSISCRLPQPVEGFIQALNIEVVTTQDRYPYLCYRREFEKIARSKIFHSGLVYSLYLKEKALIAVLKRLKISLYNIIYSVLFKLYDPSGKMIYMLPMVRLKPFLKCHIKMRNRDKCNTGIQVPSLDCIQFLDDGRRNSNCIKMIGTIRALASQGIYVKPIGTLTFKSLIESYLDGYREKRAQLSSISINLRSQIITYLKLNDDKVTALFFDAVIKFYSFHFFKFIEVINQYYKDSKKNKVSHYIVEFANPFMVQVLKVLNKKCLLIHVNRFLNNQYFCKTLRDNVRGSLSLGAASGFEKERYLRQGFSDDAIIKISEDFGQGSRETRQVKQVNSEGPFFEGKTVLILPVFLGELSAYRTLLDSTFLKQFFVKLFTILKSLSVARVIIRPHPGCDVPVNRLNSTYNDVYKYLYENADHGGFEVVYRDNPTYEDLADDLEIADFSIGSCSGVAIEAAFVGVDHICFEKFITPFPESINLSIYSEGGPSPVFTDKDELLKYLVSYKPGQGKGVVDYNRFYRLRDSDSSVMFWEEWISSREELDSL